MIAHLLIALALQISVWRLLRSWWAGALVASAWAISREITQAEYRWIERYGHGLRANMPWWGGFDPKVWTTADQFLDWMAPTVLVMAVALWMTRRTR